MLYCPTCAKSRCWPECCAPAAVGTTGCPRCGRLALRTETKARKGRCTCGEERKKEQESTIPHHSTVITSVDDFLAGRFSPAPQMPPSMSSEAVAASVFLAEDPASLTPLSYRLRNPGLPTLASAAAAADPGPHLVSRATFHCGTCDRLLVRPELNLDLTSFKRNYALTTFVPRLVGKGNSVELVNEGEEPLTVTIAVEGTEGAQVSPAELRVQPGSRGTATVTDSDGKPLPVDQLKFKVTAADYVDPAIADDDLLVPDDARGGTRSALFVPLKSP